MVSASGMGAAVVPAALAAAAACLMAVVPGCGGQLPLSPSSSLSSSFVHFPISNPNGEFYPTLPSCRIATCGK